MKKLIGLFLVLVNIGILSYAQTPVKYTPSPCETVTTFDKTSTPDLGLLIYSDDAETIWNAMRLAVYSQSKGDLVVVFVLGKATDAYIREQEESDIYNVQKISDTFLSNGGNIYLCATCAKARNTEEVQSCTITSIADMYEIVKRSKKVLTF